MNSVIGNEMKPAEIRSTDKVVPLLEEELRVTKRKLVTGRVRVRTVTETTEELVQQQLQGEHVDVERVSIGTLVELGSAPPQVRTEGNVTILPVLEEVLVVEKRLMLKEELRIIPHATKEVAELPVTLRKQRAVVERLNSEGEIITEQRKSNYDPTDDHSPLRQAERGDASNRRTR